MDTPNYSTKQYISSALLASNDILLTGSVVAAINSICGAGLIESEFVVITNPSAMIAQAVFPANFTAIFSNGLSGAHGTTPNSDTQTYSIDLSPYVPGSGSVTIHLYLTYFSLGMAPITIVGPPKGHPNYDPAFQPYTAYTYKRDSFSLNAGATLPGGSFEIARTTLSAGQTSGVTFDQTYAIKASAYHQKGIAVFTVGGTFVAPRNVSNVKVTVVGAGGGGGGSSSLSVSSGLFSGGGGGAGGTAIGSVMVTPGGAYFVTVGQGGIPGFGGTGGSSGGTSSFSSTLQATGGGGASAGTGVSPGGSPGSGSGGQLNLVGGYGSDGQNSTYTGFGNGGASSLGGGGRAGGGPGGFGEAGTAYGSGGGGSYNNDSGSGGTGAGGVVIIEW